jgi:importin subunit alpha-1
LQDFKKGIDVDDARRKRDEHGLRIRKEKREEKLEQKRKTGTVKPQADVGRGAGDLTLQTRLQKIPQWLDMIRTADPQKQLEATTHFRKLLSIERNPPIQEVIACGVVPRLVEFLTFGDHAKLIFEAAWALTNIASGSSDQTRVVIDAGAVPIFVQLLASRDEDVREQCVWALGNIAGDSPQCRDYVLRHQAMGPLLANLQQSSKLSMLRNGTWTLSNFCRGKPQPPFELVSPALPTLARLIYSTDEEASSDGVVAVIVLTTLVTGADGCVLGTVLLVRWKQRQDSGGD